MARRSEQAHQRRRLTRPDPAGRVAGDHKDRARNSGASPNEVLNAVDVLRGVIAGDVLCAVSGEVDDLTVVLHAECAGEGSHLGCDRAMGAVQEQVDPFAIPRTGRLRNSDLEPNVHARVCHVDVPRRLLLQICFRVEDEPASR